MSQSGGMADTPDLKSVGITSRKGSTPFSGRTLKVNIGKIWRVKMFEGDKIRTTAEEDDLKYRLDQRKHTVNQGEVSCDSPRELTLSERLDNEARTLRYRLERVNEARQLLTPEIEQSIRVVSLLRDLGISRV